VAFGAGSVHVFAMDPTSTGYQRTGGRADFTQSLW
jgi:hypothetical protein